MDISSSSTSKTIKLYNSKLSQTVLNRFNDEELKWDDGYLNLSLMYVLLYIFMLMKIINNNNNNIGILQMI